MTRAFGRPEDTPVTYLILLAWLTLAGLTDALTSLMPSAGSMGAKLARYGAAPGMLVVDGEPWRLLAYAFLHAGLVHLFFNSYFLLMLGPQIEASIGSLRFLVLFVVAAIGGGVLSNLWNEPWVAVVGGSGAVFGMMGAAVAISMRMGRTQLEFLEHHAGRNLLTLIGANLLLGLLIPFVSNSGHVGGLLAGFGVTHLFLLRPRTPRDTTAQVARFGWAALFLALIAYCAMPVLRWDYQLERALRAPTGAERAAWGAALEENPDGLLVIGPEFRTVLRDLWGKRGEELFERWFR